MKKKFWVTVITAMTTVTLGAIPAQAAAPTSIRTAADAADGVVDPPLYDATAGGGTVRVNVVTENRTDIPDAATAGETKQSFATLPVVTLKVDKAGLNKLAAKPGVVSVTEDVPVPPTLDNSIPLIGGDKAFAAGKTGAGSAIAVLDTGVATHHPFLQGRVKAEACFSPSDADLGASSLCPDGSGMQQGTGTADSEAGACATISGCDHGTHVAGIAAGNGTGITGAPAHGVAPGADIIAVQVFSKFDSEDYCGGSAPCVLSFTSAQLAGLEAVLQMRQAGTPVIAANLSLGGGRYTTDCTADPRKLAIDNLLAGVATVVAAGNNGYTDAVSAPGCVSSAVTVGSTTPTTSCPDSPTGARCSTCSPRHRHHLLRPRWRVRPQERHLHGRAARGRRLRGAAAGVPRQERHGPPDAPEDQRPADQLHGCHHPRIDLGQAITPKRAGIVDFNGDGAEDVAIADPAATVGGVTSAGTVWITYGAGKGTTGIHQDLDWVPGGAEQGDWFGEELATVDYDKDGYTDLVVGVPGEDVGSAADAGFVDVLCGAAGGLGTGSKKATHFEQGQGTGAIASSAAEAGDRMGHSLAAGTTKSGEPYLLIGNPGEALDTVTSAGSAFYVHGNTSIAIHQDKPGVPGVAEKDDKFGFSVAGDSNFLAIGSPGEAIGTLAKSGGAVIFNPNKLDADGMPTPLSGLDQDNPAISGGAEAGDEFGFALAIAPFRATGAATASESILAIGSPGEGVVVDGEDRLNAGRVVQIRIKVDGTWSYLRELKQGTADDTVSGTSETGDRMGETLAAVNTAPDAVSTSASMRLAVGTPGETLGTVAQAGAVHTFSLAGSAGTNDRWIEAGDGDGIPGTPGAKQYLGKSLSFTGTRLYVGMAYGPNAGGALYALPMSNVTVGGAVAPVTTYKPGTGGVPSGGVRFGYASR